MDMKFKKSIIELKTNMERFNMVRVENIKYMDIFIAKNDI